MKDAIKTIIWDLDNTLYKYSDTQIQRWHEGVVRFMQSKGVDMELEEAMALAHKGWEDHRDSNHYFIKNYGIDSQEAHIGMFQYIDQNMIDPCVETPSRMEFMRNHHHVILTYATKEWAHRILDHTGLKEFFHPDFILGAEDYNFEDKSHSSRGIMTALDKIGGNGNEVMFVEDTLPNLKPAKEDAGVYTTYLHHNRPTNDNEMDFVDLTVQDTPELLKWFKEVPEV
jgi:FMN phosphatase YigB (HAD superfamily)